MLPGRVLTSIVLVFSEFLAIKLSDISFSVIVLFAISCVLTAQSVISHAFTEFAAKSSEVKELFTTFELSIVLLSKVTLSHVPQRIPLNSILPGEVVVA